MVMCRFFRSFQRVQCALPLCGPQKILTGGVGAKNRPARPEAAHACLFSYRNICALYRVSDTWGGRKKAGPVKMRSGHADGKTPLRGAAWLSQSCNAPAVKRVSSNASRKQNGREGALPAVANQRDEAIPRFLPLRLQVPPFWAAPSSPRPCCRLLPFPCRKGACPEERRADCSGCNIP